MDKQKKFAKTPLLYIHQPDMSRPQAPMQSNYATPRDAKPAEPKPQKSNARPLKRDDFSKKENVDDKDGTQTEPEGSGKEKVDQPKASSNKKFNDMAIPEKIDYFLSKPKHIPRMKCEVKTEERTFRGTIQNVEADQILMQVGRRTSFTKVEIESIIDIRLIGF